MVPVVFIVRDPADNTDVRRVYVDPEFPQRDAIQDAAKWIVNGGVVALPTDTLYGLAADPFSAARSRGCLPSRGGRPSGHCR